MARTLPTKVCPVCQVEFTPKQRPQVYCSRWCGNTSRRRVDKICKFCQTSFPPSHTRQVYCSQECCGLSQRTRIQRVCGVCQTIFFEVPSRVEDGRGKYCSKDCAIIAQPIQDPIAHFWSQVDRAVGPDECWLWKGGCRGGGYGHTTYLQKDTVAHRLAYELTYGPIPPGLVVRHYLCDCPPCCRPSHLKLGTQADNVQDAVDKGHKVKGEENNKAKLTTQNVIDIRRLLHDGISHRAIARQFGVSKHAVYCILYRKTWKHVI